MTIEELAVRVQDLENQVSDLRNQRDPSSVQGRLALLQQMYDTQAQELSDLENVISKIETSDKYVEIFTAEEMDYWFQKSGLSSPEIKRYLSILLAREVELSEVQGFLEATELEEIIVRSRLGKYLRNKAIKNVE
jgi:hypothetical protein